MPKLIFNLFIVAALAAIQISFFSVLPFFKYVHPVLLYIIYFSIKRDSVLPVAIAGGYILDLHSSYPFGLQIAAIVFTAIFANYIYFNIITSRHFFTIIILMASSILVYHAIIISGIVVLSFLKLSLKTNTINIVDLPGIGIEIIIVSAAASAAYFIFYLARKKLSSRILFKR